jgi:TolB-like protein
MIYALGDLELDLTKAELRRAGVVVPIEPQVFALLALIVENHERLVTRDEIVERIWDGRAVSESAIFSRIKAARKAVGDDGSEQRVIRTLHGRGYRCVADVRIVIDAVPATPEMADAPAPPADPKPSIAVLPFRLIGDPGDNKAVSDAVPHDIITALSRLRWLKVIARGSAFRFREQDPDVRIVGRALGVRYCLTGVAECAGSGVTIAVELSDTSDGSVVWGETYTSSIDRVREVRAELTASIVSALEIYLPLNEAKVAALSDTENLTAWGRYHLGLQRMFRFSAADNAAAAAHFEAAAALDPQFARAYAGLSFTHFQNAYLGYAREPAASIQNARGLAERSVELDPLDPFANFTLGRSYWLDGEIERSLGYLDRATVLSPNYAQGFYARAFADTMLGRAKDARASLDVAMALSPLDPFLYAMKGTRALSYLVEGRPDEAVFWIDEAARTPGAHAVVNLVAAAAHSLVGDRSGAEHWVRQAQSRNPEIDQQRFFRAMPFADPGVRKKIAQALASNGVR